MDQPVEPLYLGTSPAFNLGLFSATAI